ncbi:hypothetical protein, partial [Staphylococcus saprophyticus]|uniref:hypothetical protein n=1 Tax=Staphylococcus saprophyticus TaxID=29385 RepID=UPI0011AA1B50
PQSKDFFDTHPFLLSPPHPSPLLYTLLHLSPTLQLQHLKQFTQSPSKTPPHPQFKHTHPIQTFIKQNQLKNPLLLPTPY